MLEQKNETEQVIAPLGILFEIEDRRWFGGDAGPPISEKEWLAAKKVVEEEIDKRAAEREPRIVALESRIGALLKDRPESKKVTVAVEEGDYGNFEVTPPAGRGDDLSFIPID